jgi:hypothetical protein
MRQQKYYPTLLVLVFTFALLLSACGDSPTPVPATSAPAVQAAAQPTPNIADTVAAQVRATIAAQPTATVIPPTATVAAPPTASAIPATAKPTAVPPTATAAATPTAKPTAAPPPTATPKPAPTATAAPPPPPALPGLKQEGSVNKWTLAVVNLGRPGKDLVWSDFGNVTHASGEWLVLECALRNDDKSSRSLSGIANFTLKDAQGRSYDDDLVEAAMYASYKDANGYTDKVAPGATLRTYVVFDVSKGLTGAKLTFSSGFRTIDFSLGF